MPRPATFDIYAPWGTRGNYIRALWSNDNIPADNPASTRRDIICIFKFRMFLAEPSEQSSSENMLTFNVKM